MIQFMFMVNFRIKSKAEIEIINGKIVKISYKNVKGKKPLVKTSLIDFKTIVSTYSESKLKAG